MPGDHSLSFHAARPKRSLTVVAILLFSLLFSVSAFAQQWDSAWFRGTPNAWGATAMTWNASTGSWETEQSFSGDNPASR
jgi:hypothetical protein